MKQRRTFFQFQQRIGERLVGNRRAGFELGGKEEFETSEWLPNTLQVLPP